MPRYYFVFCKDALLLWPQEDGSYTIPLQEEPPTAVKPWTTILNVTPLDGIEVKKGRPVSAQLRAQLARYLESDALDAVIVVTQRVTRLPERIDGKPVYIISLNRLWGVALP